MRQDFSKIQLLIFSKGIAPCTKAGIKLAAFLGFSEMTNALFSFGFYCCNKTLAKTNLKEERL